VLVLDTLSPTTLEIKNIAIAEPYQGKGYGKQLLKFAANIAREFRCQQLVIGTGNSSIGQLALYQKVGFDLIRIERNFFTNHYAEPIFENGIQCKHLLVLEKKLVN
jgi:ribosomal protein S18 acetylase RimI-like enzyme